MTGDLTEGYGEERIYLLPIEQAIAREKQIKHYKRDWKNELVDLINPNWEDLSGNIIIDPDIV